MGACGDRIVKASYSMLRDPKLLGKFCSSRVHEDRRWLALGRANETIAANRKRARGDPI
jgi:hypothetical protein